MRLESAIEQFRADAATVAQNERRDTLVGVGALAFCALVVVGAVAYWRH